jgi:5-hydroxyisourate hydrolase-like protein (transthyretin family)
MKRIFMKVSLAAALAVAGLNAQTINLNQGWNNIGVMSNMSAMDLNNPSIQYVWQYNNGEWSVYSPDSSVMNRIQQNIQQGLASYNVLNSITAGSALWINSTQNTQIRVGEAASFTSITGVVKDAVTYALINDFNLSIDGEPRNGIDNNGTFVLSHVPLGEHNLTITADGYQPFNYNLSLEDVAPQDLGQIQLVPNTSAGDINVTVHIMDAVTGDPIPNVRFRVWQGYNNTNGTPVKDILIPNGDTNITDAVAGAYTIRIDANGYYSTQYNYTLVGQDGQNSIAQDFALAPVQNADSNVSLRSVLTWGETPRDLDSHLVAYDTNAQEVKWHVYYSDETPSAANGEAKLDRDDTDSYGPETITLTDVNNSLDYKYYVFNFSRDVALKDSNAHLSVFFDGIQYDFSVPNEDGTVWKVFEIHNGVLQRCVENCMKNIPYYSGGGVNEVDYNTTVNLRTLNSSDSKAINEIVNSYQTHQK